MNDTAIPWGRLFTQPAVLIALFFLSLVPTGIVGLGVWTSYRVQQEGRKATAKIESFTVHTGGRRAARRNLYNVDYRFRVNGQEFGPHWVHDALNMVVHKDDVGGTSFPRQIEVLYVPDDPACNLPARHMNNERFALFLALCICLNFGLIAGAVVSSHYWRGHEELFEQLAEADA